MDRSLQFELIVAWNVITLGQTADKLGTESSNNGLETIWKSLPKNICCSRTNLSVTRHLRFSQFVDEDSSLLESYTLLGLPFPVDGGPTSRNVDSYQQTWRNIPQYLNCYHLYWYISVNNVTGCDHEKRRRFIFTTSVARPTRGPSKPPFLPVCW